MRRLSRELALQILFQTEFTAQISYTQLLEVYETAVEEETLKFADLLIKGVQANKAAIDALIQSASRHWKIDRMALIDRNILRIACYELRFAPSPLEIGIVINEAVEISKKFGSSDSSAFVNGILDQISKG